MKKKGIFIAAVAFVVLAAVVISDFFYSRNTSADFLAMNTTVSLDVTGFHSKKAVERIKSEIIRLDEKLLSRTKHTAEIYSVNNGKAEISDELKGILEYLKQLEKDSGGAFNIGIAQLTDLWGIGTENEQLPDKEEISAAIKNHEKWQINGNNVTLPENVKLDLGAVGKGTACDYAKDILSAHKCKEAVVAVGGSVLLYGSEKYQIGIRDPLGEINDYCAVVEAAQGCISTSGNYERYFEDENGNRYHHIFDPSTGYPADSGLLSVTVIAESGTASDALSTACFVLGIEKSLPLLEKYNADAVFITTDKEIITTFGELESETITVTNNNYSLGDINE
ncbi:MAG: FAD:protein FMN transferase [Clostridia bacterium]|nr:FAD:protein FMN transferase [Clostridia bacterium]